MKEDAKSILRIEASIEKYFSGSYNICIDFETNSAYYYTLGEGLYLLEKDREKFIKLTSK